MSSSGGWATASSDSHGQRQGPRGTFAGEGEQGAEPLVCGGQSEHEVEGTRKGCKEDFIQETAGDCRPSTTCMRSLWVDKQSLQAVGRQRETIEFPDLDSLG